MSIAKLQVRRLLEIKFKKKELRAWLSTFLNRK